MAIVKVTDLTPATLPLAGDEIVMVDQGGVSKQTTVGDISPSMVASFLTLGPNPVLAQERIFTPDPTTLAAVDNGPGNAYTLAVNPTFFGGFAAPTALVGLAPVAGTAVTAMRSDASPALDQAIAPTWTGQHQWALALWGPDGAAATPSHTFTSDPDTGLYRVGANALGFAVGGSLGFQINTTDSRASGTLGAGDVTIPGMSAADLYAAINSGNPSLWVWEGDAGADAKLWRFAAGGGIFSLSTRTDLNGAGANIWTVTRTGTVVNAFNIQAAQTLVADGAVGTPSLGFINDPNTGLYSIGADNIGLTTGGTLRWNVSTTAITSTLQMLAAAGSNAAPTYSFSGDPNTGAYSVGADDYGIATGGTLRFDVSTTLVTSTLPYVAPVGAVGAPSYTFTGDTDTGLFWVASNDLGITAGGTKVVDFVLTGTDAQIAAVSGSATAPVYTFGGDANTGVYRIGADNLGIALGGTKWLDLASGTATWGASFTGGLTFGASNTSAADGDTARLAVSANGLQVALFMANAATTTPIITSGPTGSQAVLRTLGSYPIVFGTNNTYRGRIASTGEVLWESWGRFGDSTGIDTAMLNTTPGQFGVSCVSGNPSFWYYEGDQAADNRVWRVTTAGGKYQVIAYNDAVSSSNTPISITRSGITITDIALNGGITANGQIQSVSAGSAGAPDYSFQGDTNTGMVRGGADNLQFATGGTSRLHISSAGAIAVPSVSTTASAANAFLDNASSPANNLLRSTSSIRFKQDVQDLDPAKIDILMKLRPITYRSKCEADDPSLRWYGFIAEEVAQVEPRLAQWTKIDGQDVPDGMQYERLTVLLTAYVQKLEARVKLLEKKVLH